MGGGQLVHQRKSPIIAMVFHSKNQKSYQQTVGIQEPTPMGSKTVQGHIIGPYDSLTFWVLGVQSIQNSLSTPF